MTLSNSTTCYSGAAPVALSLKNTCNSGFLCKFAFSSGTASLVVTYFIPSANTLTGCVGFTTYTQLMAVVIVGINNTELHPPEYCPPTSECLITRLELFRNTCSEPQGIYEPLICPPGHFCSPGGKEITLCPQGHYCPLGTATPFRCGLASACPEGADREFVLDGFIAILVFDLLLIVLLLRSRGLAGFPSWSKLMHVPQRLARRSGPNAWSLEMQDSDQEEKCHVLDRENIGELVAAVKACIGLSDIGLSFGFENLSWALPSGKVIIAPQSGTIPQGCVWGVMGPSGAGKSECYPSVMVIEADSLEASFVNLLMGKRRLTEGCVYINGLPSQIAKYVLRRPRLPWKWFGL
jgi:hypothetical protein